VNGKVTHLAFNGGRLFVVTDAGSVVCFVTANRQKQREERVMQLNIILAAWLMGAVAVTAAAAEAPVVLDPHVSTDQAPDFRTIDRLIQSVVKKGMTNEKKVLAVFHVIRRNFIHGPTPRHLAYDFHKIQHSLGTGACLSMTTPLHVICERMGLKSKSWVHNGHHMMEVEYDGGWHCLDPHMCFYCYDRSKPPKIASIEQLRADPTLATNAVREGRAGKGYLLCGDSPKYFAPGGRWKLERDGRWPKMKIEEPFGKIALRRGETYIRTWWPGKDWYKESWPERYKTGPIHTCGGRADRKDAANWPLYEPHGARPVTHQGTPCGGTYYRIWAVGQLVYTVPTIKDHYKDAVVSENNVAQTSSGLSQQDPVKPAELVFSVGCPYVLTAGEVKMLVPKGKVAVSVSIDAGKTWKPVSLKTKEEGVPLGFFDEINGSFDGYRLKVELADGATLKGLELVSHFQVNRFSLPHLVPGKNTVKVEAANYGSPLTVKYEWSEGEDWKTPKSVSKTFRKDGTFEITVAGPKYPRMKALTLSVAP